MSRVEVKYLSTSSEFEAPEPRPFGAHKYIRVGDEKIPNKGHLLSTIFTVALVIDGVEQAPFSYKEIY